MPVQQPQQQPKQHSFVMPVFNAVQHAVFKPFVCTVKFSLWSTIDEPVCIAFQTHCSPIHCSYRTHCSPINCSYRTHCSPIFEAFGSHGIPDSADRRTNRWTDCLHVCSFSAYTRANVCAFCPNRIARDSANCPNSSALCPNPSARDSYRYAYHIHVCR